MLNNRIHTRDGFAVSLELILVIAVAVVGLIVAVTALRDSVLSELSNVAESVADIDQSFVFDATISTTSAIAGSGFIDLSLIHI